MIKLLIVDDDHNIREGLERLIPHEELDIRIIGKARNGEEAFALFDQFSPHIVLTDIRMPQMDGLELIENIRQRDLNTRIVVLSGYDEYDFVRKAMKFQVEDYLLKPVTGTELIGILKTICTELHHQWKDDQLQRESFQLLRNNILNRWIEDRIDISQLWDKTDFLGIPIRDYAFFQTAVITWKDVQESSLPPEERRFRPFAIHNAVEEGMSQAGNGIAFIDQQQRIIALFLGKEAGGATENQHPLAWLQHVGQQVSELFKVPWFCALGNRYSSPEGASTSYREAIKLLDYIHLTGSVTCIDSNWQQQSYIPETISDIDPALLLEQLKSSEREQWMSRLNENLDWALSQNNPLLSARAVASEWIVLLRQVGRKLSNQTAPSLWGLNNIQHLFALESVGELRIYLHNLILDMEEAAQAQQARPEHSLISRIEQYIIDNVTQDLSLKVLSHKFSLNHSYLGKLFKEETGQYFSDYIHHLRLERTKKLLTESHLKVSEIGKHVGFSDPNYFFRKFKQLTGHSPSEYRKIHSAPIKVD